MQEIQGTKGIWVNTQGLWAPSVYTAFLVQQTVLKAALLQRKEQTPGPGLHAAVTQLSPLCPRLLATLSTRTRPALPVQGPEVAHTTEKATLPLGSGWS